MWRDTLECQKKQKLHHVVMATGTCLKDHTFTWLSSPNIPGGRYLVNVKMAHAYFTSGMLPNNLVGEGSLGGWHCCNRWEVLGSSYGELRLFCCGQTAGRMQYEGGWGRVGGSSWVLFEWHQHPYWCSPLLAKNCQIFWHCMLGPGEHYHNGLETISKANEQYAQRHEMLDVQALLWIFWSELHTHQMPCSWQQCQCVQISPGWASWHGGC